jgi:hypothetical protein
MIDVALKAPSVIYPSQGKTVYEYWVNCAHCSDETPLGERRYRPAIREAHARGWRMIDGFWFCGGCIAEANPEK